MWRRRGRSWKGQQLARRWRCPRAGEYNNYQIIPRSLRMSRPLLGGGFSLAFSAIFSLTLANRVLGLAILSRMSPTFLATDFFSSSIRRIRRTRGSRASSSAAFSTAGCYCCCVSCCCCCSGIGGGGGGNIGCCCGALIEGGGGAASSPPPSPRPYISLISLDYCCCCCYICCDCIAIAAKCCKLAAASSRPSCPIAPPICCGIPPGRIAGGGAWPAIVWVCCGGGIVGVNPPLGPIISAIAPAGTVYPAAAATPAPAPPAC